MKPITPDVTANYSNHTLVVSYRPASMQNVLNVPEESLTVSIAQTGEFLFQIPNEADIMGQVNLSVRGPLSEIYSQDYAYEDLEAVDVGTKASSVGSTPVEIEVDPQDAIVLANEPGTSAYKVRGRVINFEDGAAIPGRTLFIYVHFQSDDESKPLDELPVWASVKTDSTGYFSFDMSGAPIRQAFLNIAGLDGETFFLQNDASDDQQLKISQVIVVDGSVLPVLDANDDCGCGSSDDVVQLPDAEDLALSGAYSNKNGKRCVDFTQPNRSLEEFSYVKIVRTTEPEFKKIPYRKPPLLKIPNGSNFSNVITNVEEVNMEPIDGGLDGAKMMNPDAGPKGGTETIPKDLADFYSYLQNSWVQNSKYWVFEDRPFELV
ncbi:MAG: hypothetical protein AAGB22_11650, partial [Bacteroidota bacterium]